MASLSKRELLKRPGRIELFNTKFNTRSEFLTIDDTNIILNIIIIDNISYTTNSNIIDAIKNSQSSIITIYDTDHNKYSLSHLKKSKEFGSNNGSGGGSVQTDLQENAQAVCNALAYSIQSNITYDNLTISNIDNINNYYISNTSSNVLDFLNNNIVWKDISLNCANVLYNYITGSYSFHKGSDIVNKIETYTKHLLKHSNIKANINKWNPADIWMITESISLQDFNFTSSTLSEFNDMFNTWYTENKVIGVSLKKTIEPKLKIIIPNSTNYKYVSYTSSKKSKDSYIHVLNESTNNTYSIQFRTFGYAVAFQGEISGQYANHGKIGGQIIFNFINEFIHIDLTNEILKIKNDSSVLCNLLSIWCNMSSLEIDNYILNGNSDIFISKYLSLLIIDKIENLVEHDRNKLITKIINYSKSESDFSCIHLKIF